MALNPLAQIQVVTIAAVIVIFLVTLLLLRRVFFLPLIEVMERRAARIGSARAREAEADELAANAQREAEQARALTQAEATRVLAQTREDIAASRSARMAQARAEAEAILAKGREDVRALKQVEEGRLATELSACATAALRRAIGPVDDAAVRLVVKRVLAAHAAG
jgi:F-type H+-transporting ATPase subunit b